MVVQCNDECVALLLLSTSFGLIAIIQRGSNFHSPGFQEIGIVPKAGKLKGIGYTDAIQFYYDLTKDVS